MDWYSMVADFIPPYYYTHGVIDPKGQWAKREDVEKLQAQLDRAQSIAVLMAMDCIPVCPYYNARVDKECPTPRHIPEDCVKCINEYIKEGK